MWPQLAIPSATLYRWNGCHSNPVQSFRSHVPDFVQIIVSPIPVQPNGSANLDGRRFDASPSHILSITHNTNKVYSK
jgi:hypothetical protein